MSISMVVQISAQSAVFFKQMGTESAAEDQKKKKKSTSP